MELGAVRHVLDVEPIDLAAERDAPREHSPAPLPDVELIGEDATL